MPDDKEAPAPALGFSIEAKLTQNRSVTAQFFVERDCEKTEIDAQLDKVMSALERQEAKGLVKGLKITLERDKKTLEIQVQQLETLKTSYENEWKSSGRRGEYRLAGQQLTNVNNVTTSIGGLKDRISQVERDLKECEAMANGADSSADRN